jgi:hypothetical protein
VENSAKKKRTAWEFALLLLLLEMVHARQCQRFAQWTDCVWIQHLPESSEQRRRTITFPTVSKAATFYSKSMLRDKKLRAFASSLSLCWVYAARRSLNIFS